MMRKIWVLLAMLSMILFGIVSSLAQDSNTIADVVTASTTAEEADLTLLLAILQTSERLMDAITDTDSDLTLFAPTDEALATFMQLAEITQEELLSQSDVVEAIMLYHIVSGTHSATATIELDGEEIPTLLGEFAPITVAVTDDDELSIIDGIDLAEIGILDEETVAKVITPDIEADNGVIHIIDHVLLPSEDMLAEHFAMMEDDMTPESDE